jgi:hypothetical protein
MWDAFFKQVTEHTGMPRETAKVALTALGTALIVLFLLFACAARPAHAQMTCQPQVLVTAHLVANEGYASHHELTGDGKQFAIDAYNAMPPVGDENFETVTLFVGRQGYGAVVLFGSDGMYCGILRMGDDAAREFKLKVLGRDA